MIVRMIDKNLLLCTLKENNSEHVSPAGLFNRLNHQPKSYKYNILAFKTSQCKSEIAKKIVDGCKTNKTICSSMTDLSSHCVQGWSMPLSFAIH